MTGCVTSVAPHRNVLCLEKVQCFGNLRDVKQKYLLCILVKVNPWPPCLPLSLEDSLIFVLFIILGLELIWYGNISTPLFYYCCEHFYLSGFCDLSLFLAYEIEQTFSFLMCKLCQNNSRWLVFNHMMALDPVCMLVYYYSPVFSTWESTKYAWSIIIYSEYRCSVTQMFIWFLQHFKALKSRLTKETFCCTWKKKKLKKDLKSLLAHWAKRWLDSLDQWQILIALGIGLVDFLNPDWSNYLITGFVFSILCCA